MPGDKIRELLRATLPTGTGDLVYDTAKEGLKDMTPRRALDMLQQFSPGGMQAASITKLLEANAASGGKLLKAGEKLAAELTRQWYPKYADLAGETNIVDPAKWIEAYDRYRSKFGYPAKSGAGSYGVTLGPDEAPIVLARGHTSRYPANDKDIANLIETLRHEIEHASQKVTGAAGHGVPWMEGRAYPAGWEAYDRAAQHLGLKGGAVYDIPMEFVKNLDYNGLMKLAEGAKRANNKTLLSEISKEILKRQGNPITYDNLGRIVRGAPVEQLSTRARILTDRLKEAEGVKSIEDFKRTFADLDPQNIEQMIQRSSPEEAELLKKLRDVRTSLEGRWR